MTYYNSTYQQGQVLIDFTAAAQTQEDLVYELFCMKRVAMNWSEVSGFLPDVNEVSLKRSITDLKNAGKLVKTEEVALSKYGRPAYKYRLA